VTTEARASTVSVLLLPVLVLVEPPGGRYFPFWVYGLDGAGAYGLAALVVLALTRVWSRRPSTGTDELRQGNVTG
jgi:hypothetical protein